MPDFNKVAIFKWSLIFLIILTCITDIATFFWSGLYEFEINPIVLALKGVVGFGWAIAAAVFVKVALISSVAISNACYEPRENKSHVWAYLLVYLGIFVILVQGFGTYANINTTIEYNNDPVNTQPMPIEQTTKLLSIINLIFYVMTILSMLSFYVYENIYISKGNSIIKPSSTTSPRRTRHRL
jgi:hypothetical protein